MTAKGRKNKRDRERERRRSREAGAPTSDADVGELQVQDAPRKTKSPAVATVDRANEVPLPSRGVRISGAMVGILTVLGAVYMIIAGILNGGGVDSIASIVAGVILLGVGIFAAALSLAPLQIRNFVRRGR